MFCLSVAQSNMLVCFKRKYHTKFCGTKTFTHLKHVRGSNLIKLLIQFPLGHEINKTNRNETFFSRIDPRKIEHCAMCSTTESIKNRKCIVIAVNDAIPLVIYTVFVTLECN
jgi:hypothetical protein